MQNRIKNIKDSVRRFFKYRIIRIFKDINIWISWNWNKKFLNLLKLTWTTYPIEFEDAEILLITQLKRVYDTLNSSEYIDKKEQKIDYMALAIKLLEIDYNGDDELYSYDCDIEYVPVENNNSKFKLTEVKYKNEKYECHVNVNFCNAKRFINKDEIEFYEKRPHELYVKKAKHLAYKIIAEYNGYWWL